MKTLIEFPKKNEYPEYVNMYYKKVQKNESLLEQLESSMNEVVAFAFKFSEEQLNYRYAPGKWSIKEVLVHLIDDERIYGFRALSFARGETTELSGFEQDDYIKHSSTDKRDIHNILEEYIYLRKSTIAMFNGFSKEALLRMGRANMNTVSVRALGFHILGHERHHLHILKSLYK